jgi:hypothetical protein
MEQFGSHCLDFITVPYVNIFLKSAEEIQVLLTSTRIMSTLQEDIHTFMIMSRSFLLGKRNVSEKVCKETPNTHFT